MGRNKMLMTLDGTPLIRLAVQRALVAQLEVIVVVGSDEQAVRQSIAGLPCTFAINSEFTGPTSTSLHCGIRALAPSVDAAFVILADMPFVTTEMLGALRSGLESVAAPLAASRYGDVLAPPLLFRRSLFDELLAWTGEGCGKQVVMRHLAEATVVDWPVAALADIDTPEDASRSGVR